MRSTWITVTCALALGACTSVQTQYFPPAPAVPAQTVRVVEQSRDALWNSAVPQLGKQAFVINSLDKASGIVSISYTGDLARYIDCGQVTSHVDMPGPPMPDLAFPYSKPQQAFYVRTAAGIFRVTQRMSLDAHVNLVFEATSASQTKVTVNSAYAVRREQVMGFPGVVPVTNSDTITFHSGGSAAFPIQGDELPSLCVATGALEAEVLTQVE
jgi:hypothetical protein